MKGGVLVLVITMVAPATACTQQIFPGKLAMVLVIIIINLRQHKNKNFLKIFCSKANKEACSNVSYLPHK
jgi:hypothetical protein